MNQALQGNSENSRSGTIHYSKDDEMNVALLFAFAITSHINSDEQKFGIVQIQEVKVTEVQYLFDV